MEQTTTTQPKLLRNGLLSRTVLPLLRRRKATPAADTPTDSSSWEEEGEEIVLRETQVDEEIVLRETQVDEALDETFVIVQETDARPDDERNS